MKDILAVNRDSVEASSLNLTLGNWPHRIIFKGVFYHYTEVQRNAEDELEAVIYTTLSGRASVTVWND